MQLKIVGILFAALLITIIAAIKLFSPGDATLKTFDSRFQAIEDRLQKLEKNLPGTGRAPLISRPLPGPSIPAKPPSNLSIGNGPSPTGKTGGTSADTAQGSSSSRTAPDTSRSDQRPLDPPPPEASTPTDNQSASTGPAPKGSLQALESFFNALPAEKQSQAEGIFQAHLESLRYKIDDATKQGSSPQELNTLIYDDQSQIREEMKQVLSDQEYRAFLDASPQIPKP